jgi:hypothetical protein
MDTEAARRSLMFQMLIAKELRKKAPKFYTSLERNNYWPISWASWTQHISCFFMFVLGSTGSGYGSVEPNTNILLLYFCSIFILSSRLSCGYPFSFKDHQRSTLACYTSCHSHPLRSSKFLANSQIKEFRHYVILPSLLWKVWLSSTRASHVTWRCISRAVLSFSSAL